MWCCRLGEFLSRLPLCEAAVPVVCVVEFCIAGGLRVNCCGVGGAITQSVTQ